MSSPQKTTNDLEAVADALAFARPLPARHPREPGRRRARLAARDEARARPLGKDSEMYLYGDPPLPREYAFMPLEGLLREPPEDAGERVLVALDCANEQRMGPDTDAARAGAAVDRHRPPPRQLALRRPQPRRRRRVLDRRGAPRRLRRARRRADSRDRGGALHRARHRHRPVPVLEHDAEDAAPRGRAGRGGRRRPPRLPGHLRVGRVRQAEAARARARAGPGLRGRPARRLLPLAQRLHRAERRRGVLGGDHRLPARGGRRRDGGPDPRAAARRRALRVG